MVILRELDDGEGNSTSFSLADSEIWGFDVGSSDSSDSDSSSGS
ncbi:hypothetical protein A2U01_0107439, partial [Trifolium medium]|nr:hypothetical protein [Trifolium medium]